MTTRANEIRERLAVALDYIRVAPLNMLDAWDGRGKGGLSDRDMMWELPEGHALHMGERTKEQFRDAADMLLEEVGVPDLLARVEELEKDCALFKTSAQNLAEQKDAIREIHKGTAAERDHYREALELVHNLSSDGPPSVEIVNIAAEALEPTDED